MRYVGCSWYLIYELNKLFSCQSKHLLFVNNIYIAAEFYGFTCYNQTFSLTATSKWLKFYNYLAGSHTVIAHNGLHTGISFIVIRINLNEPIINDTIISHNDSLSFVLPRSVLAAAKNENHSYCKYLYYICYVIVIFMHLQFKQYLTNLLA